MNIALYYPWIYLKSGIERTILDQIKHSHHHYTIFTNHYDSLQTFPEFKNQNIRELNPISVKRDIFSVAKAALTIAFQKLDLSNQDLLLIHSDGLADLITFRNHQLPTICFCHTPLRPVFDTHYRQRALSQTSLFPHILFYLFSVIFRFTDKVAWNHFDHVIFNSQETYHRANNGGLINYTPSSIIHPGIDLNSFHPTWNYTPFFLLPGRIMWTKNLELGINAFIKFKQDNPSLDYFKLVLAGQVDEKSHSYLKKLRILARNRNDIRFVINPTDQELIKLYQNCWTSLMCSFNEDWGLTVLEANGYGKPVIAVNQGGPQESVIHNQTGLLSDNSVNSFSHHMTKLASNLKLTRRLGKQAYAHVAKYDSLIFARQLDQLINKIYRDNTHIKKSLEH